MIPIAVDDVLQVTVEGINEDTAWAWVSHVKVTGVTTADQHLSILAAYYRVLLNDIDAVLQDSWEAQCLKISRVAPAPMGVVFDNASFPIVGDVTTDGIPSVAAALIRFGSDEIGPGGRGRCFLTGVPEASTDGGRLSDTIVTALNSAFDTWTDGYTSAGDSGVPVIFSRALYGTDPPGHPANVADYTAVITSALTQGNIASQRRRRYPRNAPFVP